MFVPWAVVAGFLFAGKQWLAGMMFLFLPTAILWWSIWTWSQRFEARYEFRPFLTRTQTRDAECLRKHRVNMLIHRSTHQHISPQERSRLLQEALDTDPTNEAVVRLMQNDESQLEVADVQDSDSKCAAIFEPRGTRRDPWVVIKYSGIFVEIVGVLLLGTTTILNILDVSHPARAFVIVAVAFVLVGLVLAFTADCKLGRWKDKW